MRFRNAILLATAAIALTACSSSSGSATPPTLEDAYVKLTQALMPDVTREGLLTAGHAVCEMLDKEPNLGGYSAAVQGATSNGEVLKAKVLVDAAIGAFCPSHSGLKQQFDIAVSSQP